MAKGMSSLLKDRENRNVASAVGNNVLRLKDDAKLARIRFLTDLDDMEWGWFHPIPMTSRLGKKYSTLKWCACQDKESCEYCATSKEQGEDNLSYSKKQMFFWVWVENIYHTKPDDAGKWSEKEYNGEDFFVEPVNKVMLFQTGVGQGGTFEEKLVTWGKRYKTLCDRYYDYTKTGGGLSTSYDLVACDEGKSKLKPEIEKAATKLGSLSDIIDTFKVKESKSNKPKAEEDNGEEEETPKKTNKSTKDKKHEQEDEPF